MPEEATIRQQEEERKRISALAAQAMALARDELLMSLRFLGAALARLVPMERYGLSGVATDGSIYAYDPIYVLRLYREDPARLNRACLHSLLHCVFQHGYGYDALRQELWDVAADAAVEAVIVELALPCVTLDTDEELGRTFRVLRRDAGGLDAEHIYQYLCRGSEGGVSMRSVAEYRTRFARDDHSLWRLRESYELTQEDWQRLSRQIRTELKAFSKDRGMGDALRESLDEAVRERIDYAAVLRRFMVLGEQTAVNLDEYDYVYYTYGLTTYGNLPLVEPLEYREERRIREFVIALDTSASCSGETLRGFLRKTYDLLKSEESYFKRVDIHIVQCDSEVQSDTAITSVEELEGFASGFTVHGYGATDFRPVFAYVEELRERKELVDLRGLIYFTDGYGIYPEHRPDYEVIFAFLGEDAHRAPVPPWSMQVVLDEEAM